jgi:fumarate hydratase class II
MCENIVDKCIDGIEVNEKAVEENLNNSLMLVTPLKDNISYYLAAEIALNANKNGTTLKVETFELAKKLQKKNKSDLTPDEEKLILLTEEKFHEIVDPKKMV